MELSYDPQSRSALAPWVPELPEHLAPGDAQGPGADPEAAVAEAERAREDPDAFHEREALLVDGFARYSHDEGTGARRSTGPAPDEDVSNADLFVSFLCNYQGVPVRAVHEYDLRMFLVDWYPRKVLAPPEMSRGVPASLERFFAYLETEVGIVCPWAAEVLATGREAFDEGLESVPRHFFRDEGVADWRLDLANQLLDRVLIPDPGLSDDELWGATQGMIEACLQDELQRRWLLWRDELIRSGTDEPVELFGALVERQRTWETSPHPDLGGTTPVEAIRVERRELARHLRPRGGAKGPKTRKKGRGKAKRR